ncbi:MAG: hypothetical protein HQL49_07335 [Gammaproteobacteria bacterium]|nr:hypothetical protein [Gammaproteobacteria bacterium]
MNAVKTIALIAVATLLPAGCAIFTPATNSEIVAQRAQQRWDRLIEGDLKGAYEYLSPATREIKTLQHYTREVRGLGIWKAATITPDAVVCEKEQPLCVATVQVTTEIKHPRIPEAITGSSPVEEKWLYDEKSQNWWYIPK